MASNGLNMNAINAAYARSYGSGAPAVNRNAPPPAINMAPINAAYAHSYGAAPPAVAAPAYYAPAPAAAPAYYAPALIQAATPGTPGTPAGPAPPPIQPFLSPEQQAALDSFDLSTGYGIASEQRSMNQTQQSLGLSQASNALENQNAQHAAAMNTLNANQNAGARGIFDSSIRANDLTDISTTLSQRQQSLSLSLQSAQNNASAAMDNANAAIARANAQSGITHNLYNVYSVQNAAGQTPVLPTPATAGTPGTPAVYAASVPSYSAPGPGANSVINKTPSIGGPAPSHVNAPLPLGQSAGVTYKNGVEQIPSIGKVNQSGPRPAGISGVKGF